ncbi:T9SS type A sorting domain-containing protein [bacterium]|nr:T9SS type A sorting domain-containing protein [bacterium]
MLNNLKVLITFNVIVLNIISHPRFAVCAFSGIIQENIVVNGEFDHGLDWWRAEDFSENAAMSVTVDSTSQLSGKYSVKIVVSQPSGTDWHIQLRQFFNAVEGNVYYVTFKAKASKPVSMMCMLQKVASPYTAIGYSRFDLMTTAQTYTYSGTGPENFETAIAFFFGDMDAGTTIWIDAIQITEIAGENLSVEVVADMADKLGLAEQCGSGTLFGFSGTQPDDEWVLPIKLKTYRTLEKNWSIFKSGLYERLESLEVRHIQVLLMGQNVLQGDDWFDERNKPGLDGNWDTWMNNLKSVVQRITEHDFKNIEYEIWNEPDYPSFWPWTQEHFFETWRIGFEAVREQDPCSVIIGPSLSCFDFAWLTSFLSYCKNNDCLPDILNWHELRDPDGDKIPMHAGQIRQWMTDNGIVIDRLSNGEILPVNRQFVPGTVVSYMANIERAGIESAAHSCWDDCAPLCISNCWNNSINGLLSHDLQNARSCWWAFKGYADITGQLVQVTPEPRINIDAVAGYDDNQETINILLGNHSMDVSSTVLLNLINLDSIDFLANKERLYIRAERITNTETAPLEKPEIILDEGIFIQDGQLSTSLKLEKGDACVLRLTTSLTQAPDAPASAFYSNRLFQNYPNPFNPVTHIEYTLEKPGDVTLKIFNSNGQFVKLLIEERQAAGHYHLQWDGTDFNRQKAASGLYFYQLNINNNISTQRALLLK